MASRAVRHRVAGSVLTSLGLAVALAGCAGQAPAVPRAAISVSSPAVSSPAVSSPVPTPTSSPEASRDRMSPPAKRSGPLSGRDMPRPVALGHGWAFRVDDGSQEDGYAGNGTPTVARDPGEVAGLAVPLGCVDRGHLPRPRWALETDYAHASTGTNGLVVRLRFATVSSATAFMKQRDAALAACAAQTSSVGPNSTGLVQQLHIVAGLTVSTRTESGDLHDGSAWTEIAAVGSPASDVTLLAVNAAQSSLVARRAIVRLGSTQ
jgi:hypothetical protein